jgi:hypothetical protein
MTNKTEKKMTAELDEISAELHDLKCLLAAVYVDAKYAREQVGHYHDYTRALDALERIESATKKFTTP